MDKIRFGANYIPSKNWLHSWMDWDEKSVEEDLLACKEIGIDHIRAHVIWPYFQVDQYVINKQAFRNLESFRKVCEKVNMDFCLSVFTGWMSGMVLIPAWVQCISKGNHCEGILSNAEVIKGEKYFLRELTKVIGDCPNFLGFDLGNEITCIASRDLKLTEKQADDWNCEMLNYCEELVPGKLHNNGDDHQPWFMKRYFSREILANTGAITPLHCYALFTGALSRFGRQAEESIYLAPFMQELANAYSNDPVNRKYWVQEFGTVTTDLNEEVFDFLRKSIDAMFTENNLWGITWWCPHNISKNHTSFSEKEYVLGLFDTDNKITESGKMFSEMVKKYKTNSILPVNRTSAIAFRDSDMPKPEIVDWPTGLKFADATWENAKRFCDCIRNGIHPAIILPDKVNDKEYLKMRGIEKILDC